MKRLLVATLMVGAASNAMAERWVNVARSDTAVIALDMDSLRTSGNLRVVWSRKIEDSVATLPMGERYNVTMARLHFDCAMDTEYATTITYTLNGQSVWIQDRINTFDVSPGSVAEAEEKAACK